MRNTSRPVIGRWWSREGDRFACELCPRRCLLSPGQRGFCFVREATPDGIALTTYGRSSGFCVDPVEKKPLFHFRPGHGVLSFGTAGCNLGCRYCQNWDLSKAQERDRLGQWAAPEDIVNAARDLRCDGVAFTYNDPVIFAEYAIDVARACREEGLHPIAVTAGYVAAAARDELFGAMDAANIDLKAFSEEFYRRQCLGHLAPVLETIEHVVASTDCWVELTTLLIPGLNDAPAQIEALVRWVHERLGPDVPLHFTAFHPDYKMLDRSPTPPSTLTLARHIATQNGLRWVYTGNVRDAVGNHTWCHSCGACVIERQGYAITRWGLRAGRCAGCGAPVPGRFGSRPGTWGDRRLPVVIERNTFMHIELPPGEHETA